MKSKTTGELIPSIVFEFKNWNNLIMTRDEYVNGGGYHGVVKSIGIPVGELKKVHQVLLNPQDFPSAEHP